MLRLQTVPMPYLGPVAAGASSALEQSPICDKCTSSQQSCVGYSKDKPLRWTNSSASRGKLMGKKVPRQVQALTIGGALNDSGLQDLSPSTRDYIAYL